MRQLPLATNGELIKDKALSGGRVFSTPAFVVTTSNITPDVETGIGSWSDAEIKRALIEGVRPDHHRLPGVPLAATLTSTRRCCPKTSTPSSPTCVR